MNSYLVSYARVPFYVPIGVCSLSSEMYDYFHTGNESSFSHFESVIFSLLKRQQPPPPDRVPCGEDGVKHVEAMAKLFDRVANPRELPLTITENFFEWRGSVQLDALAQSLMNKKGNDSLIICATYLKTTHFSLERLKKKRVYFSLWFSTLTDSL